MTEKSGALFWKNYAKYGSYTDITNISTLMIKKGNYFDLLIDFVNELKVDID